MTDRPIIFSAPMVRALLDGRKTQTRRVLKPQPPVGYTDFCGFVGPADEAWVVFDCSPPVAPPHKMRLPWNIRDRLWVKEAFRFDVEWDDNPPRDFDRADAVYWEADPFEARTGLDVGRKRSPIHMSRWAARLTLTVTDVRVQRLQEISQADAEAEGIERYSPEYPSLWARGKLAGDQNNIACTAFPRLAFRSIWESLHGPDSWYANPWVVALTFDVRRGNIDHA